MNPSQSSSEKCNIMEKEGPPVVGNKHLRICKKSRLELLQEMQISSNAIKTEELVSFMEYPHAFFCFKLSLEEKPIISFAVLFFKLLLLSISF